MKQKASILAIAFFLLILNSAKADCFGECDEPFYGMGIDSVSGSADQLTVTTTGAIYTINSNTAENPNSIVMQRRIDPATNTVKPKTVAAIEFQSNIGSLKIISSDKRQVDITSPLADFNFMSDSFFIIKAKVPFSYTHTNLIQNPPWNKGSALNRMWTDGYGGSLHAWISGAPTAATSTDSTTISMKEAGDTIAHMVFPPKTFDFEGLYGQNARPFVHLTGKEYLQDFLDTGDLTQYKQDGFGAFFLWNSIYTNAENPVLLDSGIMGYKIDDAAKENVRAFTEFAHSEGFKVIVYLDHPNSYRWKNNGTPQEIAATLQWMKAFQQENDFDGWYLDNADTGELIGDYAFIRQLRADVDTVAKQHGFEKGILCHHDSVDVWDAYAAYSGLRAIMIDAYVDYTRTGETGSIAEIDDPNDPYLRFYVTGYGMSQAYSSYLRKYHPPSLAISEEEKHRALAQNLNGTEWIRTPVWLSHFKPAYAARKEDYRLGNFEPDVKWPIDPKTGWFRKPTVSPTEFITGTTVKITWETEEPADSDLTYTSNGIWWQETYQYPQFASNKPDGTIKDSAMVTSHSITIPSLKENTLYEFRIRSSNGKKGLEEIVWGHIGSFTTSNAPANCGNGTCEAGIGESIETCPQDCTQECVDTPKLTGFISQWKRGEMTMLILMQKMRLWNRAGCPPE